MKSPTPLQKWLSFSGGALLAVLVIFGINAWQDVLGLRAPASLSNLSANVAPSAVKAAHLKAHLPLERLRNLGKPHSTLKVQILSTNRTAPEAGEILHLKATVHAVHNLNGLTVFWRLPNDVQLISGNPQTEIAEVMAGQDLSFEVDVISSSSDNRQIYVEASYPQDGERVGGTAQYNTTRQQEIDRDNQSRLTETALKIQSGELRRIVE